MILGGVIFLALQLLLLLLPRHAFVRVAKFYLLVYFVVLYPILSAWMPTVTLGPLIMAGPRWAYAGAVVMFFPLLAHRGISGSTGLFWGVVGFTSYVLFSEVVVGETTHLLIIPQYGFPIFMLFLIESLPYDERDYRWFRNAIMVLALATFIVSMIQFLVEPTFYWKVTNETELIHVAGNFWRNPSLLVGTGEFYEGCLAVGFLAVLILSFDIRRRSPTVMILFLMLVVSALLTFTRFVWFMPIIGLAFYVPKRYERWGGRLAWVAVVLSLGLLIWEQVATDIVGSELYSKRIAYDTLTGRWEALEVYLNHFLFDPRTLFGYGQRPDGSLEFLMMSGGNKLHQGWLILLFRAGLAGFAFYSLFLLAYFRRARAVARIHNDATALACGATFVAVNLTQGFEMMDKYAFFLVFIYLAIMGHLEPDSKDRSHE
jgi:hypothetical protein